MIYRSVPSLLFSLSIPSSTIYHKPEGLTTLLLFIGTSLASKAVKMLDVSQNGVSISANGMHSQFEALYFAHFPWSYNIVHSFIPFQTGSGLCVALEMSYCRYPLAPPTLYVSDF